MPDRCSICRAPEKRRKVDRLLAKGGSVRDVSKDTGIPKSVVQRHLPHLKADIEKVRDRSGIRAATNAWDQWLDLMKEAVEEGHKAVTSQERAMWFQQKRALWTDGMKFGYLAQQVRAKYAGCHESVIRILRPYLRGLEKFNADG